MSSFLSCVKLAGKVFSSRVRNVHGLRVVDASVMPAVTSGNTMTPTYMIAEKASDMIKGNIKCSADSYLAPLISGPLSSTQSSGSVAAYIQVPLSSPSCEDDVPDVQLFFVDAHSSFAKVQLEDSVYKKVFQPYENSRVVQCLTVNIHPKSRGTVTLQSDDPYDMPAIDPNYYAEEKDLQVMVQGMKACYQIVTSSAMKKLNPQLFKNTYPRCEQFANDMEQLFGCMAETFTISFLHFAGSVRMGDSNDCSTVVDEKLRVLNVTGLRVVDASVMPFVTRGNIMVPVYTIAEKAADMIKENIECPFASYPAPVGHIPSC